MSLALAGAELDSQQNCASLLEISLVGAGERWAPACSGPQSLGYPGPPPPPPRTPAALSSQGLCTALLSPASSCLSLKEPAQVAVLATRPC